MVTRSELRSKEHEETAAAPVPEKPQKHIGFIVIGTIFLTLLVISMVLNATVLNRHFAVREVTDSTVADDITNQVNAGLEKYGISSNILTKKTTNKLVAQAINQVYAGKKISLNLAPVTKSVGNEVDSQLSQYGISGSVISGQTSQEITSGVNTVVNNQLNTSAVTSFIHELQAVKTAVNVVMLVSGAIVVLMAVIALFGRYFARVFSWICLWSLLLSSAFVWGVVHLVPQLVADQPDYVSFAAQCVADFGKQSAKTLSVLLVVLLILFAGRLFRRIWRPKA